MQEFQHTSDFIQKARKIWEKSESETIKVVSVQYSSPKILADHLGHITCVVLPIVMQEQLEVLFSQEEVFRVATFSWLISNVNGSIIEIEKQLLEDLHSRLASSLVEKDRENPYKSELDNDSLNQDYFELTKEYDPGLMVSRCELRLVSPIGGASEKLGEVLSKCSRTFDPMVWPAELLI